MSVISSLVVNLTSNTDGFLKGITKAQGGLGGFAKSMTGAFGALPLSIAAAGAALAALIKGQVDFIDTMGNASERLGIGVERLSALAHAANMTDVSLDTLVGGLEKLNLIISKTVSGDKGLETTFAALGISLKDLQSQDASDVLIRVSNALKGVGSTAEKAAIVAKLFGKGAAEIVQLLNSDIEGGLEAAIKNGFTVSPEQVAAVNAFEESWKTLTAKLGVAGRAIAQIVLPVLSLLVDGIMLLLGPTLEAVKWLGKLAGAAAEWLGLQDPAPVEAVAEATEAQVASLIAAAEAAAELTEQGDQLVSKLQEQIDTFGLSNEQAEIYKARAAGVAEATLAQAEALATQIDMLEAQKKAEEAAADAATKAAEERAAAAKKMAEAGADLVRELQNEIATFGMSADAAEIFLASQAGIDTAFIAQASALAGQLDAMEKSRAAQEEFTSAWADFARQTTDTNRTPAEILETQMRDLKFAFSEGLISLETFQRAAAKAQADAAGPEKTAEVKADAFQPLSAIEHGGQASLSASVRNLSGQAGPASADDQQVMYLRELVRLTRGGNQLASSTESAV